MSPTRTVPPVGTAAGALADADAEAAPADSIAAEDDPAAEGSADAAGATSGGCAEPPHATHATANAHGHERPGSSRAFTGSRAYRSASSSTRRRRRSTACPSAD